MSAGLAPINRSRGTYRGAFVPSNGGVSGRSSGGVCVTARWMRTVNRPTPNFWCDLSCTARTPSQNVELKKSVPYQGTNGRGLRRWNGPWEGAGQIVGMNARTQRACFSSGATLGGNTFRSSFHPPDFPSCIRSLKKGEINCLVFNTGKRGLLSRNARFATCSGRENSLRGSFLPTRRNTDHGERSCVYLAGDRFILILPKELGLATSAPDGYW